MFLKIDIDTWFVFCFSFLGILFLLILLYIYLPYTTRKNNKNRRQVRFSRKRNNFEKLSKKHSEEKIQKLQNKNTTLQVNLKSDLQKILDNTEEANLDTFFSNFEKLYPSFKESLCKMAPNLTANELKLCAFLRLNLSGKEISRLLNITPESVHKARYRLRKKLGLSPKEELSIFILNI